MPKKSIVSKTAREMKSAWSQNLGKIRKQTQSAVKGIKRKCPKMDILQERTTRGSQLRKKLSTASVILNNSFTAENKTSIEYCTRIKIPHVTPLPRMFYYEEITQNIKGKDEPNLTHVPYFGDTDDETFEKKLEAVFEFEEDEEENPYGTTAAEMNDEPPSSSGVESSEVVGCKCKNNCIKNKTCSCRLSGKGCNPKLCSNCKCVQLLIAPSRIPNAGYGVFLMDDVPQDKLISEFCGEVISLDEATRREVIYFKRKCSYTIQLDKDHVIDATRFGNVSRFINHSATEDNCYPWLMSTNGEKRVGMYAKRSLKAGTELTFDYGYDPVALFENKSSQGSKRMMMKKQ